MATEEATNNTFKLSGYPQADASTKRDLLDKASRAASSIAQKQFGLKIALTGDAVTGTTIALGGATRNVEKGELLRQISDAGRLTRKS